MNKNATKTEILWQAKKLFFPNEKSTMGKWEEFSCNIVNFQEAQVDENGSVGDYYETHKLGLLNPDQSKTCLNQTGHKGMNRRK